MPIRYHCTSCNQLLSITRRMIGETVPCPTCGAATVVPVKDDSPVVFATDAPPAEPEAEAVPKTAGIKIRPREFDSEEMDLTPMVDMTFLLLIFFMITASFALQKSIEVPPPTPDQKGASQTLHTLDELEANSVVVRIDERNVISVDDEPLADATALVQVLQKAMRATARSELILSADDNAFHETVVTVIDAANEAGMQKIRLASRAAQ